MPAPLIPIALGAAKAVTGLVNKRKAKREAKELERTRPKYEMSPLFQQDLDLAESELSTGLSANAENAYNQLQDKQFSSSLDAILKSGGTATNVANVFGDAQEGRLRLAMLTDQMRLNKINNLMKTRGRLAEEQEKEFEFNQWRPWADKAQANAAARQGADEQIWGGIDTIGSSIMQGIDQNRQQKQFDDYLKTISSNKTDTSTYTPPPRPNVVLPTSSPNTANLPQYQSNWSLEQEGNTLSSILNMAY